MRNLWTMAVAWPKFYIWLKDLLVKIQPTGIVCRWVQVLELTLGIVDGQGPSSSQMQHKRLIGVVLVEPFQASWVFWPEVSFWISLAVAGQKLSHWKKSRKQVNAAGSRSIVELHKPGTNWIICFFTGVPEMSIWFHTLFYFCIFPNTILYLTLSMIPSLMNFGR